MPTVINKPRVHSWKRCHACIHPQVDYINQELMKKNGRSSHLHKEVKSYEEIGDSATPKIKRRSLKNHWHKHFKKCTQCGRWLPMYGEAKAFPKHQGRLYNLHSQCTECVNSSERDRYKRRTLDRKKEKARRQGLAPSSFWKRVKKEVKEAGGTVL